jgi:hypothetical protein
MQASSFFFLRNVKIKILTKEKENLKVFKKKQIKSRDEVSNILIEILMRFKCC